MMIHLISLMFSFFSLPDNMSDPTSTDEQNRLPKDGLVVQAMLEEMGITNYEPKLIPMVLDFMHRS